MGSCISSWGSSSIAGFSKCCMILSLVIFEGSAVDAVERTVTLAVSLSLTLHLYTCTNAQICSSKWQKSLLWCWIVCLMQIIVCVLCECVRMKHNAEHMIIIISKRNEKKSQHCSLPRSINNIRIHNHIHFQPALFNKVQ